MGGFSEQPYIYPTCAPRSERQLAFAQSNFNPRAATQAAQQAAYDRNRPRSWQNGPLVQFDQPVNSYMVVSGDGKVNYTPQAYESLQAKKKTKPEGKGPLINFNQHPDSWMVVTSQTPTYTPMPANTKAKVKTLRWIQFVLRVLEELGALGLLVCMICFKNMPKAFSWIMRIAPAWDVVVSLYAIYHLVRSATARTAASSASYHIFALVNDVGLLPFYIYLCLYARNNYEEDPNAKSRWDSLFSNKDITTKLLFGAFIGTATVAGLHLASAILDMWLIVLFKQIAKLPPDVNPLEDNLTSRASRRSKHKYKNSEATLTDSFVSEKKGAYLSGSTLSVDQASQLSKDVDEADSRRIPFNHTRVQQAVTASPNKLASNRLSREDFEDIRLSEHNEALSNRNSPSQVFDSKLNKHASLPGPREVIPWPPSFREHAVRPTSSPKTDRGSKSPALPNAAPSTAAVHSQQKSKLLNDNWYTVDDDNRSEYSRAPSRARTPAIVYTETEPIPENGQIDFEPQPLKMNPPTPPPPSNLGVDSEGGHWNEDSNIGTVKRNPLATRNDNGNASLDRNLTVKSVITSTSSVYSTSDIDQEETDGDIRSSIAAPKGKYYGDLASATRGVLGSTAGKSKSKPTTEVSRILSSETTKSNGTIGVSVMDSTGLSALGSFGYGLLPKRSQRKKDRVISRTGVDIVDYAGEGEDNLTGGLRGRRDVSGKIAEEGRGGSWWSKRG